MFKSVVVTFLCALSLAAGNATVYKSATDVLSVVPADTLPPKGKGWTEIKAEAVNDVLKKQVMGQPGQFRMKVAEIGKTVSRDKSPEFAKVRGTYFMRTDRDKQDGLQAGLFVYFDDAKKAALAKINVGDTVTVRGTFVRAEVILHQKVWVLALDLGRAEFVQP